MIFDSIINYIPGSNIILQLAELLFYILSTATSWNTQ